MREKRPLGADVRLDGPVSGPVLGQGGVSGAPPHAGGIGMSEST